MEKRSLPTIATYGQYKWHRKAIYRELIGNGNPGSPATDIGTANEIRLINVFELLDWYVENFGTPYRDYMPEMK